MIQYFLDNLWLWKCGLPEAQFPTNHIPSYEELKISEWSPEFEQLMRNRLVLGAIRYGKMGHGAIPRGKPRYDRCASIRTRLLKYEETGNAEWLVDISNIALLMYEERYHPNFHFRSIDDDVSSYHDKKL